MPFLLHKGFSDGRWQTFPFATQLSHIGSEVGRLLHWRGMEQGHADAALWRALELIDLTIDDPRWGKRRGELLRLREVVADLMSEPRSFEVSAENIRRYFLPFMLVTAGPRR